MLWLMTRTLGWPERAAWLVWTWGIYAATAVLRVRRNRDIGPAA
jgi:hypothetical protein